MTQVMKRFKFGDLLRFFRGQTVDKETGKPLSQDRFAYRLSEKTGLTVTRNKVNNWENGRSYLNPSVDRDLLIAILTVLHGYRGIKTLDEANQLMEAGNYRALSDEEMMKVDSNWASSTDPSTKENNATKTEPLNAKITGGYTRLSFEPTLVSRDNIGSPGITKSEQSNFVQQTLGKELEISGRALSDTYSETDLLGYEDYVQALADFIESHETQKPLTIGIDAPWGGGKTTLMHMLEKKFGPPKKLKPWQKENNKGEVENSWAFLQENIKTKILNWSQIIIKPKFWRWPWKKAEHLHFYTVWFNAWKYDQEEILWAALVLEILDQVSRQIGNWRRTGIKIKLRLIRFEWGKFMADISKSLAVTLSLGLVALVFLGGLALILNISINEIVNVWLRHYIKILSVYGVLSLFYTITLDIGKTLFSPFNLGVAKYLREPDYKNKVGFINQFQEDFKAVTETVTERGKWPLIVFVDDLDRCTPSKAADVIEGINLLLDSKHCVFILGMDAKVLSGSIQAKYKDLHKFFIDDDSPDGLSLGRKFLEKIVQINFRMPRPDTDRVYSFINSNLSRSPSSRVQKVTTNPLERLIMAEQRAGKSLEDAKKIAQETMPEKTEELAEAVEAIQARSFDDNLEVQQIVYKAASYLDHNPRKIKRYINLFRLHALIAYRRGVLGDSILLDVLGKWIIINLRWPDFLDEVARWPKFLGNYYEIADRYLKAEVVEKNRILNSLMDVSLIRNKQLINNQNLYSLLKGIPKSINTVVNYLQLIQAGKIFKDSKDYSEEGMSPITSTVSFSAPLIQSLILGRENDVREIKSRLMAKRRNKSPNSMIIIRGWPGSGKTALATVLTYDTEIVAMFPDGVLWTQLGQEPNNLSQLTAWGRGLGNEDIIAAKSIEEAQELLAEILRNKRMLLIIDDVWDAKEAAPFIIGGTDCATIITTRLDDVANTLAPIADDIYRLKVLSDETAIELLRQLAPTVVKQYPKESFALAQELEGLPLVLQIVGRLLNAEASYGFGIAELIDSLRGGSKLLEAQAPPNKTDATETPITLRTSLQKSLFTLDDVTRDCFAYLGVFASRPATFDFEAMKSIWQVEDPKSIVKTLVDRGLLEYLPELNRYQMHSTLVMLAKALLADDEFSVRG